MFVDRTRNRNVVLRNYAFETGKFDLLNPPGMKAFYQGIKAISAVVITCVALPVMKAPLLLIFLISILKMYNTGNFSSND